MNYRKLLTLTLTVTLTLISFYAIAIDSSQTTVKLTNIGTPNNAVTQDISIAPSGDGTLKIDSATALLLPKGNSGARPPSPESGMIRWSTTASSMEAYDGSSWGAVGGGDNLVHLSITVTTNQIVAGYATATVNYNIIESSSDPSGNFDLGTDTFTAPRSAHYRICHASSWGSVTWTAPMLITAKFLTGGVSHFLSGSQYVWQTGARPIFTYGCRQVYMASGATGVIQVYHGRAFNTTLQANDSFATITEVPTTK